jgi:phosphatidylserine/phosphatidylglycerophosphate/cardiolipin synthase-like enzyme
MEYVYMATGFTGALTLVFLMRELHRRLSWLPTVSPYFSPKGGCTDAVLREVQRARRQILVQGYSFTSEALARGLIEAKKRGVDVEVLLDKSNEVERYSDLHVFLENGLPPLIDHNHAIAHNKIMIIDRRTLITGSFNFTNQAEHENAENLLVIKGHPELIQEYYKSFLAHKAHCKPAETKAPTDAHARGHKAA